MTFWIHATDDSIEPLAARHRDWRLTSGNAPQDAEYEVLVAGRPTPELLTASKRLHTLVIPFAGIPAQTSELLADLPDLSVRTVHHTAGPTAELALALVLAAARALLPADQAMRTGDWTPRFIPPSPTMLLAGHPAVVVGYGEVGRRVARSLAALEMEVHALRNSTTTPYADAHALVHPADHLSTLIPQARVVVLAAPATPATTGLLDAGLIARLPTPSVVVNVARATLLDEAALYARLRTGEIAAGLDVWHTEATSPDATTGITASVHPFHTLPNVILSPHRGGAFSLPESQPLRLSALEAVLEKLAGGK